MLYIFQDYLHVFVKSYVVFLCTFFYQKYDCYLLQVKSLFFPALKYAQHETKLKSLFLRFVCRSIPNFWSY